MEHNSHFIVVQFVTILALALSQKISNEQCTINKEVVVADANVRFGLIMSLRKNDQNTYSGAYSCSLLSREPLQNYLAAEWVVDRLNKANNGTGYIPGVKIGFYGMDDCRSAVYSSRNALSFLDAWVPSPSSVQNCIQNEQKDLHFGLIGPSRSSTATRVASLLRDVKVPIISMSATSAELSNSTDYPTFFRTVPSDDHQVNMIVEILEQMSWTYVAVVYSNDDYGYTASVKLSELASKKGICIFKSFSLGTATPSLNSDLLSLIKAAKGNSIAIPFIGNRDNAEQFLWTLNKLGRVYDKDIRYGFHLILSESTNTDVTIYNSKEIGVSTMAIGGSNIFLDDLYRDLTEKVNRVKNGTERHALIEQYNSENINGIPLVSLNILDTFVPLTVHAVFALVEALKAEHKIACSGVPGVCLNLRTNVQNGKMLDQVKTVYIDYKQMDRGVPPDQFRENNYTVSFDKNGDIRLDDKYPVYSLNQYRGQQKYEEIGSYINGHTVLKLDKIKFTTPSGQPTSSMPTSVCSQNCADCLSNNIVPVAYQEGDVYILGVFSIHEPASDNPFKCGEFRNIGSDAIIAEGFLFAVNELRNITGIKFGAIAIDDCYSPLRSTSILSQYFSDLIKSDITVFTHHIPKEKFVGVVACRSSGCTIPTARFFMPMNLPVVSYSASSADLDSKIDFPYFLRTVPSDVYQAKVMLDIVKTMKWEYVGLLYVKNNYGAKGMEEFKKIAVKEDSGVCVAPELGINEKVTESDGSDFRNICVQFINRNIKVVVFFGIDDRFRNFLSFMEKENFYGKFIFIASEDWGINLDIYNSGQKSARGSLTFKVQDIQLESYSKFKNHLASKSPTANDSNIWFTEFWQNEFSCNLKGAFINSFEKDCVPDLKLNSEQLDIRTGEQRVTQVMNAVYALGNGLAEAKRSLCEDGEFPCNYFYKRANLVIDYIKKQTRLQGNLMYKVFDINGNGALGFDVFNIQQVAPGVNPYVKVGSFNSEDNASWNPTVFQKENIKFYSDTGSVLTEITSKCSEDLCQHCQAPRNPVSDGTSEQSSSSSMSNYRQSDVLIISLIVVLILAVLVAICAMIICFTSKYQSLKKTMKSYKDEIYDEPDRVMYQPYTDTHGIRFANAMNPYPIINSVGVSNFDNSTSNVNGGVNNMAFINDIDSVSQVVAMGNRKTSIQTDLQNQRSNPASLVSSGHLFSPHSSRPLPVSPIGENSLGKKIHSYDAGLENRMIYPSMSVIGSQNDPASMKRSLDSQSLPNEQVYLVTSNSMNGKNAMDAGERVVYYMQGPNGQLAPHVSSSVRDASVQQRPLPLQQQSSVHSQNSVSSSTVNPSYGPYSTAAHHRQNLLKNQEQQLAFSTSNPATTLIHGNPPTGSEYPKIISVTNARQLKSCGNDNGDQDIVYSPVLYASPSRYTQESLLHNIAAPHQQPPISHTNQPTRADSILNKISQPTNIVYNSESDQDDFNHHVGLQEQLELSQSPARSPQQSRHSMMSSCIPDVVGHSSLTQDLQRQISLESVDLTSSKDSLDDLDINIKYPGVNKNDKGFLRAISALSGNISKV